MIDHIAIDHDSAELDAPKRQFHHKVRTGCLTCKNRRVKCDEARPTCLRCRASGKECLGYPALPEANIFEPTSSKRRSSTMAASFRNGRAGRDDSPSNNSSTSTATSNSSSSLIFPHLTRHTSSSASTNTTPSFSFADPSHPLSLLSSISSIPPSPLSHDFTTPQQKFSHDFFRHWLSAYTAPRAHTLPDIWTSHYPRAAASVPALRDAMLANGAIGTALLRRCSPAEYETARLSALRHTNSAISYMLAHPQSPAVIVMLAWLFWLLDQAQGYFASAAMHIEGALKVGGGGLVGWDEEERAVMEMLVDVRDSSAQREALERAYPQILGEKAGGARERMRKCLPVFRGAVERVVRAQLKLAFEVPDGEEGLWTAEEKAVLLGSLRRLRKELEWLIERWTGRVGVGEDDDDEAKDAEDGEAGLLSPYLEEISSGEHSVEFLCVAFARTIPVFVSNVGRDDLEMRQDLVELLQITSLPEKD
jgi:hypothetical protein